MGMMWTPQPPQQPRVCNTCSVKSVNGDSVAVSLGDGNCVNCQNESRRKEKLGDGIGTKDGTGAGDHDKPYRFGRASHSVANMEVQTQLNLLRLRGAIQDRRIETHRPHQDPDGL